MTLSEDLLWRNLIKDKTFADNSWLDKPQAFYMGIDASADSLTVGNLAFLILGRRLAEAGWKPVLLMGGGTSLVGDPGGKTEERQLKSREEIQANIAGIQAQVTQLFAGKQYELVDNYDWLSGLKYLDFLREVGKYFSMTELMQREFVTERMGEGGSGISYAEFSYSLVQGYDFWHLYENHQVVMQIGGSDQWGNMLSGVALIRKRSGQETHALSMPLIVNKLTGQKFGKSEEGAVWLDPNKTSVYKFYQFWLNVDDESAIDYLKIFTMLDKDTIEAILREFNENRGSRSAQKALAYEVTKLVHGEERADSVKRVSTVLFGEGDFLSLEPADVELLGKEIPRVEAAESLVHTIVKTGLAGSNSEATRFLDSGAISINGKKVESPENGFTNGNNLLKRGKNSFALVVKT
jgi:tyrosyl-tRNA synthetase